MVINIDVRKEKDKFEENEIELINNIFGLFVKNVYFSMKANIKIEEDQKFINFTGISGVGKTVIKDEIKDQAQQSKSENIHIIDFDDLDDSTFYGRNILEILNIHSKDDEILKILSGFGLFEMRILTQKYETLSQGQKTRLKYIYLFNSIENDKQNYIFIDEFLTFVDDLSGISFASNIKKYLSDKNVKLFTFGVNFNLIGQFEDVTYVLGNSTISAIIKNNKIEYLHNDKIFEDIKINKNMPKEINQSILEDW